MAAAARRGPNPPNTQRKDPPPRDVVGSMTSDFVTLVNPDPRLKYVLAYANDSHSGVPYYERLGYEVVRQEPNGVHLRGGKTVRDNEPIEYQGSYLMAIDKEVLDQIEARGRALTDRIEQTILDRSKAGIYSPGPEATVSRVAQGFRLHDETRAGVELGEI